MKWSLKVNRIISVLEFLDHGILNFDQDSLTANTFPEGTLDKDLKMHKQSLHHSGFKIGVSPDSWFKRGAIPTSKFLLKEGEDNHLVIKPFFRKVPLDFDISAQVEANLDRWFIRLINTPDLTNIVVNTLQGIYEFGLGAIAVYLYKKFLPPLHDNRAVQQNGGNEAEEGGHFQMGDIAGNNGLNMAGGGNI